LYFCALDPLTPRDCVCRARSPTSDAAVIAAALLALGSRITKDHLRKAEEWLNSP